MKNKITMKEVFVNDFYSDDWSEAVVKALDSVGRRDAILRFPGGGCEFRPHPELTCYAAISNHNSNREHPFAIILDGCENIELAGEPDTEFIMNERFLIPIRVSNCRNVVLRNISIDFSMDIYIQAKVVRSENDLFELELETPCEVTLKNGILHFNGEAFFGAAEVEPETLGLRHGTALNFREDYPAKIPVEILAENRIRFSGQLRQMPPAGIRMTLRCGKRTTPAIFIEKSEQVRLAGITVYQAAGMGVIAQASKDICIDGFCVKIAPGSNRCYSISADALHFVNCYGNLRIENCLLENEYDDAVNIHGIYSIAEKAVSPSEWLVRRPHPAQAGVPLGVSGNRFRAVDPKTLATFCEFRAERIEEVDDRYIRLTSDSIPMALPEGAALENLDWRFSEVVIQTISCVMAIRAEFSFPQANTC